MSNESEQFWQWFAEFAKGLENPPLEPALDQIFKQLQKIDERLYFLLSNNTDVREIIITADGNVAAFPIVDSLVEAAPENIGWKVLALKPPKGFGFKLAKNGVEFRAGDLWFSPLESKTNPTELGIRLAIPSAEAVFGSQTAEAAYSILQTGIGERSVATDIKHIDVVDVPADPAAEGYFELPRLAAYIEYRKANAAS